ncbi:hypothetical protein SLEP1_g1545 [Rubroshorea leprosula]|uniref:SWIM-type domain-containing protein n=1 Tax=Rubroshorea leprosula TaxID=152421 RepID=A0AAV5HME7_9ROSI|nr:hypothetical protein SLEP1_g1545 [Rubroshorea leprosula]
MPRHLKSLAGDDSIRDVMRIVRKEMICEFYVDHEVNFAEIAPLPIGWIDNDVVYEDWGPQDKVGQNGNNEVNEGEEEGDIGNITQDRPIGGNKEADPVDGSDKDDDEAIAVKAIARSLRRPTEGLEVPPGFKGSKTGVRYKTVAKKPTPLSTPTKKATDPTSTSTSKGVPIDPVENARRRKEKAKLAEKRYKTLPQGRGSYKGKDLTLKKGKKGDPVHPSQSVLVDNDECLYSDNDGRDSEYAPSDDAGKLRDSSTDSEDDIFLAPRAADRPRRAANVYFNPAWDVPSFEVGMRFQSSKQFKEAVKRYSVRKGCPFIHIKNEPKRQRFVCKSGLCSWEIYASFEKRDDSFKVKSYYPEHTCFKNPNNKMMTCEMVAEYFKSRIYATSFIKCKDMMRFAYNELRVNVNFKKCEREMEGNYRDEYAMINAFGMYLKEVNPGNLVFITTDENSASEKVFSRMYVCLKAVSDGWKKGCRPIFGVDSCFLKGICKGILLSAVGRDGNNQMYPITWAVVESENNDSWQWFMEKLANDLELGDGHGYTVISDRHPGIINAKTEVLPLIWHKYCARHLYCNLARRNRADDIKLAFWLACRATNEFDYLDKMDALRALSEEAYAELNELPDKKLFVDTWATNIAPRVLKKINDNNNLSMKCNVRWNGDNDFAVFDGHTQHTHVVNVHERNCSCREWNLTGIPCSHALCALRFKDWSFEYFVDEYYKKEKYLQTYGTALECLRGNEVLRRRLERGCLPLEMRSMLGRPRRNRRRAKDEPLKLKKGKLTKLSKHGSVYTYSVCGEQGHNKAGCQENR